MKQKLLKRLCWSRTGEAYWYNSEHNVNVLYSISEGGLRFHKAAHLTPSRDHMVRKNNFYPQIDTYSRALLIPLSFFYSFLLMPQTVKKKTHHSSREKEKKKTAMWGSAGKILSSFFPLIFEEGGLFFLRHLCCNNNNSL